MLGRAGVVFGHDLTTEAALTKLSFLLALPGLSYTDITTQMSLSLRGEMTELKAELFAPPMLEEPTIPNDQTAFTALGHAIALGDIDAVTAFLDADPSVVGRGDYVENTPLHLAAVGPDTRIVTELLRRGASVHARNRAGNTPLFLAKQVRNTEIVGLLKESGAMLNVEEKERRVLGSGTVTPVQRTAEEDK